MRRRPPTTPHEIAVVALDFRRAIEKAKLRRHAKCMGNFPIGCCKHSSQLLARYLVTDLQTPLVTFVHGERGGRGDGQPWQSHVWLRVGGYTVDITADQYPEVDEPVVLSMGAGWHSMWEKQRHLTFGEMMHFDFWEGLRFRRMYSLVLKAFQPNPMPRVTYPLRNAGPPAEVA
jgi:hypothetical protein